MNEEWTSSQISICLPPKRLAASENSGPDKGHLPSLRENSSSLISSGMTSYKQPIGPATKESLWNVDAVASSEPSALSVGPVMARLSAQPVWFTQDS